MPQMAPISWILMLMFFILNLFLFSTFNYSSFNVNYSNNYNSLNKKKPYMIESDNKSSLSFWPLN